MTAPNDRRGTGRLQAERAAPWVAALVTAAVFASGAYWGTNAVGGSDSHCYVGQARMFLAAQSALPPPLAGSVGWPNAPATFVPSGFAAAGSSGRSVPLCPAGLPLIMAGAMLVGGTPAWFWIVPLFGAACIYSTYKLGGHLAGRPAGAAAAVLMACSPVFLYQLFQPMSDVPTAAMWTMVLALSTAGTAGGGTRSGLALSAGLAAGLAIMIRPNLAPLAVVPAVLITWRSRPADWRRGAWFTLGVAPGVAAVAALQTIVYGAPWQSGYGALEHLFAVSNVWPNLRRYPMWIADTHTPILVLACLAPFVARTRLRGWLLLGFVGATLAAYLPYVSFEDWSYARFLLPAMPTLVVLTLLVVQWVLARTAGRWAMLAFACAAIAMSGWWLHRAADLSVFRVKAVERKYPELGRYAASRLPGNAVVLGAQTTGTVRYYANFPTLSWDAIDSDWLDRVAAELASRGLQPYLAVESFEMDAFRARFRDHTLLGQLDWPPRATFGRAISLYRLDDRPGYLAGARIPTDRITWLAR